MLPAGRDRAHVHPLRSERVHSNAVAEQSAARATPGRVDSEHRDVHVRERADETIQYLVRHAALAGAAGAGNADYRRLGRPDLPFLAQFLERRLIEKAFLDRRDGLGHRRHRGTILGDLGTGRAARGNGASNEILDHRLEAEFHAVVGVVDALDAVFHQRGDLLGRDRAAAAAKDADVAGAHLLEPVHHVAEELVVTALVGADGNTVGVFLDGRTDDVVDTSVVAQMHDLDTLRLNQPAHDVDSGIVAVKERSGGDES